MPLHPLGISRSRDISHAPAEIMAGALAIRWSQTDALACAVVDAPHGALWPLHHATALEAIHRHICVLPMRFGSVVGGEAEIRSLLLGRAGELLDRIAGLDGACEMAVRITLPNVPNTPGPADRRGSSPVAYLQQRRFHYQCADTAQGRDGQLVRECVQPIAGRVPRLAQAVALAHAGDPSGIPCRTQPRGRFSWSPRKPAACMSGRAVCGPRSVAAVQFRVRSFPASPIARRSIPSHPNGAERPRTRALPRPLRAWRQCGPRWTDRGLPALRGVPAAILPGQISVRRLAHRLLLQLVLLHEQLRVFGAHQNRPALYQPEQQLMVPTAGVRQLTDNSLLEAADGQTVLINTRFRALPVQGVEVFLDVGPQRINDPLALSPTRPATDPRIIAPEPARIASRDRRPCG